MVQKLNQRDFSRNTENNPLMSASSRVDLNTDQDRNDETGNVENFEDGNFPSLRSSYDRQAHAHHSFTGKITALTAFTWQIAALTPINLKERR